MEQTKRCERCKQPFTKEEFLEALETGIYLCDECFFGEKEKKEKNRWTNDNADEVVL